VSALEAARAYLELGWRPVPIVPWNCTPPTPDRWSPGKTPWDRLSARPLAEWQQFSCSTDAIPRHFIKEGNVGVLLGESSGWLVDVDLDCDEAIALAPKFLPLTWSFGRSSRPRSHWLYIADGSATWKPSGAQVELRSTGAQTVLPTGTHKTGERIAWTEDLDALEQPTTVDAAELRAAVGRLAAATLVARHAGLRAATAWAAGGPCPQLEAAVMRQVGEWAGLVSPLAARPMRRRATHRTEDLQEAIARYRLDHPLELPRGGSGKCPACGHRGCFGALPGATDRWACWSASHHGVGLRGESCWHGDALDLDAHAAGVSRVELLKRQGYLMGARA